VSHHRVLSSLQSSPRGPTDPLEKGWETIVDFPGAETGSGAQPRSLQLCS
jgi:hypothetical protein